MQTGFAGSPPTLSRVLHFVVNSQNYHTPTRRSMSERNESADPHETRQVRPASGSAHVVLHRTSHVVLALALAFYFIAAGLFLGLRYVLLPRVDAFRPRIEAIVSEKLHTQFTIGKLAPHWSGFQPGLDVTNIVIRDPEGKAGADHSARHRQRSRGVRSGSSIPRFPA